MPARNPDAATPECPDLETIAALVEGRLPSSEQTAVRAHLTACDDCAELAAGLTQALDASASGTVTAEDIESADRAPVRPRWRWPVATSALAAAAALVLVAWLEPRWFGRDAPDVPELAGLVAAAGDTRSIEGRLTGGFPHGPVRTPDRSTVPKENVRLLAAAGAIQEAAERETTQATLHAWGVAQLAVGEVQAGLDTLEDAAGRDEMTARLAADLGAARLAAADTLGRADLLPRALAVLEESTAIDPELPEPWFTKAIVLERLRLPTQAADAWRRYLELDPSSDWSDEARQRVTRLTGANRGAQRHRLDDPPAAGSADDRPRAMRRRAFL